MDDSDVTIEGVIGFFRANDFSHAEHVDGHIFRHRLGDAAITLQLIPQDGAWSLTCSMSDAKQSLHWESKGGLMACFRDLQAQSNRHFIPH